MEFVLVAALLVFLLFAVLQVAVYFYARTVVAASAADAARYAAAENVPVAAGADRADRAVRRGLDHADASAVRCTASLDRDVASGLTVTTVRCRGRLHVLFTPLPLPLIVDVRSSVLREGTP